MKGFEITFEGTVYTLFYSGEAMFDIDEIIGEAKINEAVNPKTKEGFQKLCKVVAIMAEQGELMRRYMGYEPREVLEAVHIRLFSDPVGRLDLYTAVMNAYVLGLGRDITGDKKKEVNLTRSAMLSKKKEDI